MKNVFLVILSSFLVVGCAILPERWRPAAQDPVDIAPPDAEATADDASEADIAPPNDARTAEAFDTTTAEERAAATSAPAGAEKRLGTTVAALGDVAEPGLWIKTPLADAPGKGRVTYAPTGASVAVDLIPLDGEDGAGSQLSLAAMRLLGVNLTDLPEIEVYRSGN